MQLYPMQFVPKSSRAAALIWIMGHRRALGFRSQLDHRGRIMTYVLIVVSWLGGAVNGAAVSTQEFASVERCEAARLALVTDAKARGLEDQLRPICLQK